MGDPPNPNDDVKATDAANAGPAGGAQAGGAGPQVVDPTAVKPVQVVDLAAAIPAPVTALGTVTKLLDATPSQLIGRELTLWMLRILAGSIVLLLIYLGSMEWTAGSDIRRNYGKDMSRDDISLYMAQRIQRFSNDLAQAQSNPSFAAPKDNVDDDKALSDTLGLLPDLTADQHTQLNKCVLLISLQQTAGKETAAADRASELKPCVETLEKIRGQGMMAATTAMSFQLASEASSKLLEERQNLHEFWLKAAQLILLNLLLPILTAAIGYTFGNNQAQQRSQGSQ